MDDYEGPGYLITPELIEDEDGPLGVGTEERVFVVRPVRARPDAMLDRTPGARERRVARLRGVLEREWLSGTWEEENDP